jgi:hypothetical protein
MNGSTAARDEEFLEAGESGPVTSGVVMMLEVYIRCDITEEYCEDIRHTIDC